jgi:hypothetical protein
MLSRLHYRLDYQQNCKPPQKGTKTVALLLICLSSLCTLPSLLWAEDSDDASEQAETEATTEQETEAGSDSGDEKIAPIKNTQRHLPNIPQKRTQSLIHHLELMERQDEIVQLNAAEEVFYGFYLPEATGSPQGAVLILHDNQQHGHWPKLIAPLRESLPQNGWTTFSIELPELPASQRIMRDSALKALTEEGAAENSEENSSVSLDPITTDQEGDALLTEEAADNDAPDFSKQPRVQEQDDNSLEPSLPRLAKLPDLPADAPLVAMESEAAAVDPFEQYQTLNRQRIITAIDYLKSKGQLNLVILGHGTGAAWAIDYVAQINQANAAKGKRKRKGDNKGLTLVTIDARPSINRFADMNQQLIKMSIPYLDIIQPSKALEMKYGKAREAIMKRNQNPNYQQIISADIGYEQDQNSPIIRRIRGWIKAKAGGTLVKMSR